MTAANGKQAVYAGTFDPITYGHVDIVRRALAVFDRVHIAVANNPKKDTLFSSTERRELASEALVEFGERVEVHVFDGLLVDFVRSLALSVIIRGLRAVSDYEYEAQMAMINRQISTGVETVFFVASEELSYISSSIVKDVARNGGQTEKFVPPCVTKRLFEIFS